MHRVLEIKNKTTLLSEASMSKNQPVAKFVDK